MKNPIGVYSLRKTTELPDADRANANFLDNFSKVKGIEIKFNAEYKIGTLIQEDLMDDLW